ncbi:MAG TPA: LON peptidase substrate-binding domain-containing protein, partial [Acidimicrobiales bacterium]
MRRLPMFPLSTVLFPGASLSLHVFEPRYRQLTVDCLRGGCELGVVLIRRGSEVGGGDERVDVGTVARIETATPLADG